MIGCHLCLGNALHLIFNGIFYRDDFDTGGIQPPQQRIEHCRFTRSGGSRGENHTIRFEGLLLNLLKGKTAQSQLLKINENTRLIEKPCDDTLPMIAGDDADAHVDTLIFLQHQ